MRRVHGSSCVAVRAGSRDFKHIKRIRVGGGSRIDRGGGRYRVRVIEWIGRHGVGRGLRGRSRGAGVDHNEMERRERLVKEKGQRHRM